MSESTTSIFKRIAILLALALVGLFAPLTWSEGKLRDDLSAQAAELEQTRDRLSAPDAGLDRSQVAAQGLRSQIADEQARGEAIEQELGAEQERARRTYAQLRAEHEACQAQSAELSQRMAERVDAHQAEVTRVKADLQERIDRAPGPPFLL